MRGRATSPSCSHCVPLLILSLVSLAFSLPLFASFGSLIDAPFVAGSRFCHPGWPNLSYSQNHPIKDARHLVTAYHPLHMVSSAPVTCSPSACCRLGPTRIQGRIQSALTDRGARILLLLPSSFFIVSSSSSLTSPPLKSQLLLSLFVVDLQCAVSQVLSTRWTGIQAPTSCKLEPR